MISWKLCELFIRWNVPPNRELFGVREKIKEDKEMRRKQMAVLFAAAVMAAGMTGCSGGARTTAGTTAASEAAAQEERVEKAGAGDEAKTAGTGDVKEPESGAEDLEKEPDRGREAQEAQTDAGEEDEENYNTGDASMDNTRNQNDIGDKELLVISFGTSYNDNRRMTIGAIEEAMEKAFPDYGVRRGFTSQIIIDRVKSRDKVSIDNVGEALDRAVDNGVKTLVVQPTHLMNGLEYGDLVEELAEYSDAFEHIAVGEPLLTSEEDFAGVIRAVTEATAEYDDGETAICFMGHGTEAESNQVYGRMQKMLADAGYDHYYVGTVEAEPTLEDVLAAVQKGSYRRVVLEPLMIVAGDHANNDMAGDEEDSWKTVFENAGYEVVCILRGLGELEAVQQMFVEHAQAAMDRAAQN